MKTSLIAFCLLLFSTVFAQAATDVRENTVWYRVHLGTGVGELAVSTDMLKHFIDTEVSQSFPAGFTITEARGQWKSPEVGLIRERTIVIDIQCDDSDENWGKVQAIAEKYVKQFTAAKASCFVKRIPGVTATLFY